MGRTKVMGDEEEYVSVTVKIPLAALEGVLAEGEASANGEIVLSLYPPLKQAKKPRKAAVQKQTKASLARRKAKTIPEEVEAVIKAWNTHPYIARPRRESRNEQYLGRLSELNCRLFKSVVKKRGLEDVIDIMTVYLNVCEKGGHISGEKNFAFKTLISFMKKLDERTKKGQGFWWMDRVDVVGVSDPHPELTVRIANSYARTFLGSKEFPLESDVGSHKLFRQIAGMIHSMVDRHLADGEDRKTLEVDIIKAGLTCMKNKSEEQGKEPSLGWMKWERFWTITVTHYMRNKGLI